MKIILIFLFLITSINIFAQDSTKHLPKVSTQKRKLNVGYPRYYAYAGLGILNGERLGGIVHFHENFSVEASYGFIFGTGWSLTNPDNMANLGASVHFRDDIPVFCSLIYTWRIGQYEHSRVERYASINAGYLDLTEIGMQFMCRVGLFTSFDRKMYGSSIFNNLNLDISLGYSF